MGPASLSLSLAFPGDKGLRTEAKRSSFASFLLVVEGSSPIGPRQTAPLVRGEQWTGVPATANGSILTLGCGEDPPIIQASHPPCSFTSLSFLFKLALVTGEVMEPPL